MSNRAEDFFYEWAGFSYDPLTETAHDGKARGADELARAEADGREAGLVFRWVLDDINSSDFDDLIDGEPYPLYVCLTYHNGAVVASLGGVGFRDGEAPWKGDPYRRVVEAELAMEALAEIGENA